MARDMSRVGANKACDEESGIGHGHPHEGGWEMDENMRDGGKKPVFGGVADKKDHRKDAGGGERY